MSKKVQFERSQAYDDAKIPKRGSSRGTSMASSIKNKDEDLLDNLEEFFPKHTTDPKASTN